MKHSVKFSILALLLIYSIKIFPQTYIKVTKFETNCKNIFPAFVNRYDNTLFFMCEKNLIEYNLAQSNYYRRSLDFNIVNFYFGDDGNLYAYGGNKKPYKSYLYNNGKFTYQKEVNSIPDNIKNSKGNLWKLENNKIYKYTNNKFVEYVTDKNRINDEIYAFDVDKYENVWIETEKYFAKYDGYKWNKWNKIKEIEEEHGVLFERWVVDSKGNIWRRANGSNLLYQFDGTDWYDDVLDVVEEEFYKNYLMKAPDNKLKEILFINVDKNDNLIFLIKYNNNLYIVLYNEDGINK